MWCESAQEDKGQASRSECPDSHSEKGSAGPYRRSLSFLYFVAGRPQRPAGQTNRNRYGLHTDDHFYYITDFPLCTQKEEKYFRKNAQRGGGFLSPQTPGRTFFCPSAPGRAVFFLLTGWFFLSLADGVLGGVRAFGELLVSVGGRRMSFGVLPPAAYFCR